MVLERVKSKNLFNFRPQGFVDEDIEVYENEKRALRAKQGDCCFHQKSNIEWTVFSLDFFLSFPKQLQRLVDFIDEIGVEELLKNASVEDFVRTARSLSLQQYDGSTPFESHPEIVEVINWSDPSSKLPTHFCIS